VVPFLGPNEVEEQPVASMVTTRITQRRINLFTTPPVDYLGIPHWENQIPRYLKLEQ
jgi:hypothetical protein